MAYISDLMTWDSFDKFCPDEMLDQVCLVQAKQFSTKYHPVPVVDSTLFETDLWRKKLLTRP